MPYIKMEKRLPVLREGPANVGELNYAITDLIQGYLNTGDPNRNYAAYNEVIGVLECAKLELYRRQIAVYEDQKCRENGDVYRADYPPSPVSPAVIQEKYDD